MSDELTNLRRLRDAADKVIDGLSPADFPEAINWGDLGCVSTSLTLFDDGSLEYQVNVEEADPHCPKLRSAIEDGLKPLGWTGIEVVTSW